VVTEQLVLLLLLILGVFAVFAPNLKCAVLGSGAFGLWISFAYLLYSAPDVALAEAVISGSLGTIICVITIRNYKDITVRPTRKTLFKGISSDLLVLAAFIMVLFLNQFSQRQGGLPIFEMVVERYEILGGGMSHVAGILLNYRLFDTLFEALMLLVSGIAVAQLIKHEGRKRHESHKEKAVKKTHPSDFEIISLLVPAMILVGAYIIINDDVLPGGGFQGGAALAAVLISHFIISPKSEFNTKNMETVEKFAYMGLVACALFYVFGGLYFSHPANYTHYMLAMNLILGTKVFCGLTIIFIEFAKEYHKEVEV